jgi:hypothetical protein
MSAPETTEVGTGGGDAPEIETIWLTKPSIKPIVLAASLMLAMVGLFGFRPLMFAAILVAVITMISWITESRHESDELPLS